MMHIDIKKHKTAAIGTGIGVVALVFVLGYGVDQHPEKQCKC
ncbi:MAG: hypothetical protein ABF902_05885 [Liquorilactobacillus sp.]